MMMNTNFSVGKEETGCTDKRKKRVKNVTQRQLPRSLSENEYFDLFNSVLHTAMEDITAGEEQLLGNEVKQNDGTVEQTNDENEESTNNLKTVNEIEQNDLQEGNQEEREELLMASKGFRQEQEGNDIMGSNGSSVGDDAESVAHEIVDDWNDSRPGSVGGDRERTPSAEHMQASVVCSKSPKKAARQNRLLPKKLFSLDAEKAKQDNTAIKVGTQKTMSKRTNLEQQNRHTSRGRCKPLQNSLPKEESDVEDEENGTWVQCCKKSCNKWRYLGHVEDPLLVPDKWECKMNLDQEHNACDMPEIHYDESEHIYTKFTIGSIVWAKMDGYPCITPCFPLHVYRWPAMVETDPDYDTYFELLSQTSMLPTQFHVSFLDDRVTRAWIKASHVIQYAKDRPPKVKLTSGNHSYEKEIRAAMTNADTALELSLQERLSVFGFEKRHSNKSRFSKYEIGHSDKENENSRSKSRTSKGGRYKTHIRGQLQKSKTEREVKPPKHRTQRGRLDENYQPNDTLCTGPRQAISNTAASRIEISSGRQSSVTGAMNFDSETFTMEASTRKEEASLPQKTLTEPNVTLHKNLDNYYEGNDITEDGGSEHNSKNVSVHGNIAEGNYHVNKKRQSKQIQKKDKRGKYRKIEKKATDKCEHVACDMIRKESKSSETLNVEDTENCETSRNQDRIRNARKQQSLKPEGGQVQKKRQGRQKNNHIKAEDIVESELADQVLTGSGVVSNLELDMENNDPGDFGVIERHSRSAEQDQFSVCHSKDIKYDMGVKARSKSNQVCGPFVAERSSEITNSCLVENTLKRKKGALSRVKQKSVKSHENEDTNAEIFLKKCNSNKHLENDSDKENVDPATLSKQITSISINFYEENCNSNNHDISVPGNASDGDKEISNNLRNQKEVSKHHKSFRNIIDRHKTDILQEVSQEITHKKYGHPHTTDDISTDQKCSKKRRNWEGKYEGSDMKDVKKLRKPKNFCAPAVVRSVTLQRRVSKDREVPSGSIPVSNTIESLMDDDPHVVPDMEKSTHFHAENYLDVKLLQGGADTHDPDDNVQSDADGDDEDELDLNLDISKINQLTLNTKRVNNEEADVSSLDLDMEEYREPVVAEEFKGSHSIIGRFGGRCCEHGSDSDPLELIED